MPVAQLEQQQQSWVWDSRNEMIQREEDGAVDVLPLCQEPPKSQVSSALQRLLDSERFKARRTAAKLLTVDVRLQPCFACGTGQ